MFFYWKSKALGNYRSYLTAVCLMGSGWTKEKVTVKVTMPSVGIHKWRLLLCVWQENSYLGEVTNSPWGASKFTLRWLSLSESLIYMNYYFFQKLISCYCLRLAFWEGLQFIFKIAKYLTISTFQFYWALCSDSWWTVGLKNPIEKSYAIPGKKRVWKGMMESNGDESGSACVSKE